MNFGGWTTGRGGDFDNRAGPPTLGLILLFGMVIVGAVLIFAAGGALIDAIESESERERALSYMSQTDQSIETAMVSDGPQSLEVPPDADLSVTEDGEVKVAWYNATSDDDPWSDASCTAPTEASGDLGTLEYELDDRTIIHQGGGIWEYEDGETSVVSEPQISYDNESLQLQIMQIAPDNVNSGELTARSDHSKSTQLISEIESVAASCGEPDVAFRIESSYHDGWYDYLEDAVGTDEFDDVFIERINGGVEVRIEGVREPLDRSEIIVEEDRGLTDANGDSIDPSIIAETGPRSNVFLIDSVIKNTGSDKETQDVTVSIWNESAGEIRSKTEEVTLERNEVEYIGHQDQGTFIKFNPDDIDGLSPGNTYNYTVSTEDDELDEPGSFYYGKKDAYFEPANLDAAVNDDEVTLSFELENTGIESSEPEVELDLEYLDGDTPDAYDPVIEGISEEFEYGQSGTIEWPLNTSRLLGGEYEATIDPVSSDESVSTRFNVSVEGGSSETGIGVGEPVAADVSVLGTQVSGQIGDEHHLIPVDLSVVTESGGERTVQHQFTNSDSGDNINTYDAWQEKGGNDWTESIEIDEDDINGDEVTLTLSATSSEWRVCSWSFLGTCLDWDYPIDDNNRDDNGYTHYYNDFVDQNHRWIDVDATTGESLQNVRVRNHENDTVPELRAAHDLQMSADDILDREGLWDDDTETLDLGPTEYVFLFEVTYETNEDGTDALWDLAQNTGGHGDPNFNDLIVYVDVERAGVEVDDPYEIVLNPTLDEHKSPDSGENEWDAGNDTGAAIDDTSINIGSDAVVIS